MIQQFNYSTTLFQLFHAKFSTNLVTLLKVNKKKSNNLVDL